MLRVLARRARAQWPLLAALLAVLTLGATLLGTCALLVTRTSERAVEVAASRAAPDDVAITAYTVAVTGADARSVAADTRTVLASTIAPFRAGMATRASSVLRTLPAAGTAPGGTTGAEQPGTGTTPGGNTGAEQPGTGTTPGGANGAEQPGAGTAPDDAAGAEQPPGAGTDPDGVIRAAYLSGLDDLRSHARLLAGRWPRAAAGDAPLEAALFGNTARLLGLTVGSRVRLGAELSPDPPAPVDVTVVGLVSPLADAGWDRDPLGGSGYDPDPTASTSARPVHAYGPFLVDLDDLLNSGSALDRLEVTANPDLSAPTIRDLNVLTTSLLGADRKLAGTLGDRVEIERVSTRLTRTLLDARGQQRLTAGAVLALALIGIVLTAIALALAGRLTTAVRAGESALFAALGTSRGQFAAAAVVEAGLLAAGAAVLAVPASSALHAASTHLPPLSGAGLAVPVTVTGVQVLAVGCGALALAVLHVGLAVRPAAPAGERRPRGELLARSGADLLLVALAAVGWWQLRAQPAGAGTRADTVRVLAPVLLLTALTALILRLVPPALRWAERLAGRGRGLILPLAASGAARRPQAIAAGLLIGLGCAAATFGTAFDVTWHTSQHDQADLAVGTDLTVALAAAPVAGQGAALREATGGRVSPAVQNGIAVGQWLGGPGTAPQLVAVDTRPGPELLRGRLDRDRSWSDVTRALVPPVPVKGLALARDGRLSLTGTATGPVPILVRPQLLVQDDAGLRTSCTGPAVPLDGRPHAIPDCVTAPGLHLVAVSLPVLGSIGQPNTDISVTLAVPGVAGPAGPAPAWTARAATPETDQLARPAAAVAGNRLRMSAAVRFADPSDSSRVLVAMAFPDPGPVPVAVSAGMADAVDAHRGSRLSLTVDATPVDVVVADVVPTVPSAPGAAAILADVDSLSRVLVAHGNLDPSVNAWWVGHPARSDAAARATGLKLGAVTTRAGEADRLSGSPLRASLPAVLRLLVAAAILLLLGGVVLHVTCDVQFRALEVARLRGLGMSRRDIRAALLGEHAAVLLPLLIAGAIVGAIATQILVPLLIRSDTGAAPVPAALTRWPWSAEAVLFTLLVAGTGLAVAAVVSVQARRADAAHLRVTS